MQREAVHIRRQHLSGKPGAESLEEGGLPEATRGDDDVALREGPSVPKEDVLRVSPVDEVGVLDPSPDLEGGLLIRSPHGGLVHDNDRDISIVWQ